MAPARAEYDDDELVLDIAEGRLNYRQISIKHGLSLDYVGRIARGHRRPELQPRIDAAVLAIVRESRRLGARMTCLAWSRLGNLAGATEGVANETQRKAAVDILKLAQAGDLTNVPLAVETPRLELADLSDDTKAKVLSELEGPQE